MTNELIVRTAAPQMKFFTYSQNNSGGHFDINDSVSLFVIIEAASAADANAKARSVGIYFNGCEDERDCPCCGDRWYSQWDDEGDVEPTIYGEPVSQHMAKEGMRLLFAKPGKPYIHVYYANGEKITYLAPTKNEPLEG